MLTFCQMTSDFSAWLQDALAKRDMTSADLARVTGKDQGIFSRIIRRERKAENETLRVIAKALKLPAEVVFRAAGELPDETSSDEWVEEMNHKIKLVPKETRPIAEKLLSTLIAEPEPKPAVKPRKAKA